MCNCLIINLLNIFINKNCYGSFAVIKLLIITFKIGK